MTPARAEAPSTAPTAAPPSKKRSRVRNILRKLGLSLASLVVFFLLLELVVQVFVSPLSLWRVRDGVFHHSLPNVNGIVKFTPTRPEPVVWLPSGKGENEVRVVVLGESSVQGAPWGLQVSAPAMLYDMLRQELPEREVTVINMGRTSSMMIDAYYYLLAVARYRPDVIIFYQGTNDRFDASAEICAPVNSPTLHGVWRWFVRHSRLLWLVRVHGPTWMASLGLVEGMKSGGPEGERRCSPFQAFPAWTRLLTATAAATGAKVVVTTPTKGDLIALESAMRKENSSKSIKELVGRLSGEYRALLSCALEDGCDFRALYRGMLGPYEELTKPPSLDFASLTPIEIAFWSQHLTAMMGRAWRASAEAVGGTVIDFHAYIRDHERHQLLLPPLIADTVHLSLDGYWLLAHFWAKTVAALVRGEAPPDLASSEPPVSEASRYVALLDEGASRSQGVGFCDRLRFEGKRWLRARSLLISVGFFLEAWERCRDQEARDVLDWLRRGLGHPMASTPERSAYLDALDIERLAEWSAQGHETDH